jgi:hypothetical protein
MRTHISLPEDLIAEVDKLAGKRQRSAFIEEAVRAKVRNEKMLALLDRPLKEGQVHIGGVGEEASRWVHESRQLDEELRSEKLKRWQDG